MATQIFNTPDKDIPKPKWDSTPEQDAEYIKKLIDDLHRKGYKQPDTGFILRFQAGDGYAEYMVISTDTVRLYHLALGDAWTYPVHKYTKTAIIAEIKAQKQWAAALAKLKSS